MNESIQKVIWLVNKHAAPLQYYATHARTINLAKRLSSFGHDVRIINSSIVHNSDIDLIQDNGPFIERDYDNVKHILIKTIRYGKRLFKRVISLIQFAHRINKYSRYFPKPDIIIHTTNIPFDLEIRCVAKRLHAKYIIEVVDIWPDTFVSQNLISKHNPLFRIMSCMERMAYTKADNIVFSMEGGKQHIIDKKWDIVNGGKICLDKVHYINNGISVKEFNQNKLKCITEDPDLTNPTIKRVIYLGSMGYANNVSQILDVAKLVKDPNITFLLYGNGDERKVIEERICNEKISNVVLKQKWIEPQYVPYVLSCADVNVLLYNSLVKFHYGGSQNKMFLSIAAGKPIFSTVGSNYSVIANNHLGIDKHLTSPKKKYDAIMSLLNLTKEEKNDIALRSKKVIGEYDYDNLAQKYSQIISQL
jgi:glycosyltransferase involved in cell wall biosynthesis